MYWGCGAAAALSSRLMCSRRMLGPTTTSARRRWISSFWQPTAVQQSPLTLCLNTRMASNSVVQRVTLRSWVWESCSRAGAIGSNVFQRGVSQLSSWTHVSSLGHSGATLDSLGCSCRCQKGKHNRDGFDYAIPACFSGGFFWAKEVLEAHRTLATAGSVCPACGSETREESMQSEMAVLPRGGHYILLEANLWPSFWRAGQKSWQLLVTGRTRGTSQTWDKWQSTTPQRSTQPPCGELLQL